jgi:hypothetical protein
LKLAAAFLLTATILFADGGSILLRRQSGPFLVTVFGTPQAGPNDFSILVQNASDRSPILDAQVEIQIAGSTARATRDAATNKLLYAAALHLHHSGRYELQVNISRNREAASVRGPIAIPPAPTPWRAFWPYYALVPAAISLFALNQWIKKKRRPPAPS